MVLLKLIRVRETLFSLPLAYSGMLLAAEVLPSFPQWCFVTTALVSARTYGMCLNRILDREFDAQNPRTSHRLIPSGKVLVRRVVYYALFFATLFVFSAYQLNSLCFYLSFPALFLLTTYSLTKRYTTTTHLYLGLTEACAPIGGALAVTPALTPEILLIGIYVLLWIAGFDIIYACQDYEFDRAHRLHSIPARYGIKRALTISSLLHAGAMLTLITLGILMDAHSAYWLCLTVAGYFFIKQHLTVKEKNLGNIEAAFFHANRNISLVVFTAFLLNFIL